MLLCTGYWHRRSLCTGKKAVVVESLSFPTSLKDTAEWMHFKHSKAERENNNKKKKDSFWFGVCLSDLGFFHVGQEENLQSGSDWHLLVSVRFPCCPGQPNNNVLSTRGKTQDCNLASELEDITFPMCLRLTRKLYNL